MHKITEGEREQGHLDVDAVQFVATPSTSRHPTTTRPLVAQTAFGLDLA